MIEVSTRLVKVLWTQGQLDEAEPLMRRALALSQRVLGPEPP